MIVYYKKTLRDNTVQVVSGPGVGIWASVTAPTDDEIKKIVDEFGIPKEMVKVCLDKEELVRIDVDEGIRLFIFKIPLEEGDGVETVPFGVIITADKIVSICLKEHPIIADFTGGKVKSFQTTTKTRFLLQIIKRINHYFQHYLSNIEKRIEEIEKKLLRSVENREIIALMGLQNTLLYFNTATVGNNSNIERLLKGGVLKLYEDDADILEDMSYDSKQVIEMVGIYSGILSGTMDAYASIVSNNLNIVMKFLAAVTIIMSVPVMVSSFYGMNVILPFQDHPAAFVIVVIISLSLVFLTGYVFAKKKFL